MIPLTRRIHAVVAAVVGDYARQRVRIRQKPTHRSYFDSEDVQYLDNRMIGNPSVPCCFRQKKKNQKKQKRTKNKNNKKKKECTVICSACRPGEASAQQSVMTLTRPSLLTAISQPQRHDTRDATRKSRRLPTASASRIHVLPETWPIRSNPTRSRERDRPGFDGISANRLPSADAVTVS